ncbi:PTS sugar transporter [Mangrovactinospora gilvigrisea]|uniref:Ascorbate-specific PTS system EIIA component n=1 Tax=Mangrovactinospora gilvigrisea TaxID=1428644 RepID=A0A1J7BCV9_9ACTN|nr:PTS sugar transporter subunit IIA [Mangrovactinospora gilvigrisea]OIV36429.1 PTS sugar transporter [Mangrovactinospora gilvigrisea]
MTSLSELVPVEAIRLDVTAETWRNAIEAAGELLTGTGTATPEYTAEMIRTVEEQGPYIVVAPGFALAHARPSPAVLRTGMSWVRLAHPVEFGHADNDPVNLVVALAAKDSAAHTRAMGALARLLADPDRSQALREAPNAATVHALLAGKGEFAPAAADGSSDSAASAPSGGAVGAVGAANQKILTVCGNGLGTSLFLKNTLEQVLDRWKWSPYITVEATDSLSARGKAKEAVAIFTSGEIGRNIGDVGVPVKIIKDFTSLDEVDRVLRDTYDV